MLTEVQESTIERILEEFVYDVTGDPVRIQLKDLQGLQVALAGKGFTIGLLKPTPIVKPDALAAALMPAGSMPPNHVHMSATQILRAGPAQEPMRSLTPVEESIVHTTELAAQDLQSKVGYTFRADKVLSLTRIIRRLTRP